MRMNLILVLLTSISLSACSSMRGNVVPEQGPTMEQVYDSMQHTKKKETPYLKTAEYGFHPIPNPELTMYVYPHLAGNEELPIPGYYTQFNAYTKDHYTQA